MYIQILNYNLNEDGTHTVYYSDETESMDKYNEALNIRKGDIITFEYKKNFHSSELKSRAFDIEHSGINLYVSIIDKTPSNIRSI